MKEKFLHKRALGTVYLLMIAFFLMLFPTTVKSQSHNDDTRFAVTVKQSGDTVIMEAFLIGPVTIDGGTWGFFYDPTMLQLYDTSMTAPINYYGLMAESAGVLGGALKIHDVFADLGFELQGDALHYPAMDFDDNPADEKYSGNHFMNVFYATASPTTLAVITVAPEEVIPFFTCYFKKLSADPLTSEHFGIGTNVNDAGYSPSLLDYTNNYSVGYIDLWMTTYDEVDPALFLYRSPSQVISKSAVVAQNSVTFTGTFASWIIQPSETLFDGETGGSGTITDYKTGRLHGDTIRSRGFIYTEANADVDFTWSEFSPMATIDGATINLRDSIANGSDRFTVGGNVYHFVETNTAFYDEATDYSATVNGLTENEEYYAWAFDLYTFETSSVFSSVGERLEFTVTATSCDLQAGSVYITAYPTCAAGSGESFPIQNLSDIPTSDNDQGSVNITVTGGSGTYEYTYTKYGEDSVRQYSDLYLASGTEYYIGGLEVGTYRFYIRDKSNPSCEVVSESVVLGTQAYGAIAEFLTEVEDASACGQQDGSITFQMAPFSEDYYDNYEVAFYVNGEKLPETAMVEGTIINGTYTISNLAPGTYVILATLTLYEDIYCAVSSQEIIVGAEDGGLDVAVVATPESECEAADGALAFTIAGGTAPYTYQVDGMLVDTTNASAFTATDLVAGNHVWSIVDATGCRDAGRATIDNTAAPDFDVQVSATGIACTAGSTGTITLTIAGGTPPYYYSYKDTTRYAFNAGNTPTISNLSKGVYDITVYDAEGCVFAYQNVVIDDEPFDVGVGTIYVEQSPTCGGNDGRIYVEVTGNHSAYAYSVYWDGDFFASGTLSGGVGSVSGLEAGTYYLEVDAGGLGNCGFVYSESITLSNTDSDLKLVASATNATDCGSSTGSISFHTTGGDGSSSNYTYFLNGQPMASYDGQSTGTILNQSPGIYVLSVYDQQCYASSGEIIIGAANGLVVDVSNTVNATCDGTDGSVQLTVTSGGTAPYAYQIDGKQKQYMLGNIAVVTGLAAGDHVWTVYDATGCQTEGRFVILNEDENGFFVTATPIDVTCAGDSGAIFLNIVNGDVNGHYSYTYDSHSASVNFIGNQVRIPNLTEGIYDITIRDEDNDCDFMIQNIIIGKSSDLQVGTIYAVQQATSCTGDDGQIYIAVTGGTGNYDYSIQWNNETAPYTGTYSVDEDTIKGLAPGTYRIWVTDLYNPACGTILSEPVVVTSDGIDYSLLVTGIDPADNCGSANGSIAFNLKYTGSTDEYDVYLQGPNTSASVYVDNALAGDTIIRNLYPGTYVMRVENTTSGCEITSNEIVIPVESGNLDVTTSVLTNATCDNTTGSFSLKVAAATQTMILYQIDGGETLALLSDSVVVAGLSVGSHAWRVTDASGCYVANGRVVIENSDAPDYKLNVANIQHASCDASIGGTFTMVVSGGVGDFSYSLDNGKTKFPFANSDRHTLTDLAPGSYDIIVYDGNNNDCEYHYQNVSIHLNCETTCPEIGTIYVVQYPDCNTNQGTDNAGLLYVEVTGGSGNYEYTVDPSSPYTDLPNDGLITVYPGSGGVVQVYIQDKNYSDCDVVVSEPLELYSTNVDMKVSYVIDAIPSGCGMNDGEITVSWVSSPSSTNAFLYKNGVFVTSATTNDYSVSFGSLSPGLYEVRLLVDQTYVDGNTIACMAGTGIIALEPVSGGIFVDVTDTTHTICGEINGGFVLNMSGGIAPYTYQIDGKASQTAVGSTITITNLMAGNHVWKIFDNSGCFAEGRVEILNEDGNGFTVSAVTKDAPCGNLSGGSITLTVDGGTAPFEYVYQKYDTTQWTAFTSGVKATINNLSPGTYDVYVKDATGCVYEYQNITIEKSESELTVATVAVVDQPTCNEADGSVYLQASGGKNLYYYYTLNGVESMDLVPAVNVTPLGTGLITNLAAGTYRFYVYDDANFSCGVAVSEPLTLINTDSELKLVAISTDASGCDAQDGTITFQTSGGTGFYYYKLNESQIFSTDSMPTDMTYGTISVRPGDYVLTVRTQGENCTASTAEITIGVENSTFAVTESDINPVTDCSAADGSFVLTVAGGTAPYRYQIDGGEDIISYDATITVNGLAAGSHVYTVIDSAACYRAEGRVEIWNGDANGFTAAAEATNANCVGTNGFITLTVANGQGSFAYSYNGSDWVSFTGNTVTIPDLNEGNYDITVIDSNNMCAFMIQNVIIERESLTVGTISLTAQPTCSGNEGEIYINVTGGSGNYNYSFDNFVSGTGTQLVNDTIKNLATGTYRVWIKDNNAVVCGVVVSEPVTLRAVDSDLAIVVTSNNATDCIAKDGSITYTITGSATPVAMVLTSTLTGVTQNYTPAASGTLSGLTPGAYVLTVTDDAGCTVASDEVVISTDVNGMDVQVTHTASSCGETAGTLLISMDGTAPYQYQIDGGAWTKVIGDTILVTGLRAGYHTWHIMDADTCFATGTETIENLPTYTNIIVTLTEAYCDGLGGGTIHVEVVSGTDPLQYTLDNGQTWTTFTNPHTITNLAVGSYDIIVKDGNDCEYEYQNMRIDRGTESGLVVGTVSVLKQPTCGNDDGEIYLSVTGATTPAYSIDGGATWVTMTDSIIRNAGAGTYRIMVRDEAALACGTAFSESITLENTDSDLSILSVAATSATDCSSGDATITFSVDGGTPAYTVLLDGAAPANQSGSYVISQVSAGRHILSVEDNLGCMASVEVFIETENGMTVTPAIAVYPTCGGSEGSLQLTISGSSAPFTYQIDGGAMQAETGNVILVDGLAAGLHSWKVTASDGCYMEDTIRINNIYDADAFVVDVTTTDAACGGLSGGTIAIKIDGGLGSYAYTVDGGVTYVPFYSYDTTLMDLSVGSYDIVVRDLTTGCEYIYQDAVINRATESSLIVGTVNVITQPTCGNDDGQVYLSVTGALVPQYRLNGTGAWTTMTDSIISGLTAGTYIFEVRDSLAIACGTAFSESITLENIESDMVLSLVMVADANGCDITGAEGKIWVDVKGHTGSLTYYLDGVANPAMNGDTIISVAAGYHVVTVSDGNCLSSAAIVISGGANGMTVNSTVDADATCTEAAGAITLTINNGTLPFQYRIDGGTVKYANNTSIAITGLAAGVHNWTVISADGCYASDTIRIDNTDPDAFVMNATTTDASCDGLGGGTITIEINGTTAPYTYTTDNWETSYMFYGEDTTLMELSVGSYDIVVRDANDCEYMYQNAVINRIAADDVEIGTIAIAEQPTCAAPATGSVYLAVIGGSGEYVYATALDGTYEEFPTNDTITNLTPGTYVFYIKDKFAQTCGTVVSNPITINSVDTDLGITVAVTNASDCETGDGALTFLVTGGIPEYSYKLNGIDTIPVGNSFPNLIVGSYVVTVTDNNGCMASSSALFIGSDDDPFTATPVLIRNTTCGNAEGAFVINLSRSGEYQYQLDGAAMGAITGDSIVFTNLAAGSYSWWIKDSCNLMEGNFTITNTDVNGLAVQATPTNALCDGSAGSIELEVTGGTVDFSYSIDNGTNWESFGIGETSVIIPDLTEGTYDIIVKDAANCTYGVRNVRISVDQRLDFNIGTVAVAQQPDCGEINGKLYLVVTPAGSTYQYSLNNDGVWNSLPTNDTISNVPAGTYRIYVRDNSALACGVLVSDPITINPANSSLALSVTANAASACGVADGSLSLVVTGGMTPYTNYTLNGSPVSPVNNSIPNLKPGRYIVSVSDDDDCVASSGEVLLGTSGAGLVATATPADDALCLSAVGSFDLKVSTGKAPFMYQINGGILQTTEHDSIRVADLAAGTHVWWIMDADSCITTGNVDIENSDNANFVIGITSANAGCDGTPGALTIAAAGGQSTYSYSLNDADFIPMATDTVTIAVSVGIYDIIVRDAAGCVVEYNNAEVKNTSDLTPPRLLTPQTFCQGATVANLTVLQGTGIVWYDEDGELLDGTEILEDGKIYYAAQTVGNCESSRSYVKAIINDDLVLPAPNLESPQYFCDNTTPTIADIAIPTSLNPANLVWYSNSIGNNALPTSTTLVDSALYYVEVSAGGSCVSVTRSAVMVIFENTITIDSNFNTPQYFCEGAVVANLEKPNNQVVWYLTSTGGAALDEGTVLIDGMTYYAAQSAGDCESVNRIAVEVILTAPQMPFAPENQSFCDGASLTLANLRVTGAGIVWYADAQLTQKLPLTTPLTETTYYAVQSSGECEGNAAAITVIFGCFDLAGTVFPFVHRNNPTFDALFPVTVSLYELPPTGTRGARTVNYLRANNAPLYVTKAVFYDATTHYLPGTPLHPGVMGRPNNPGDTIDFTRIGMLRTSVDGTVAAQGQQPTSKIGYYQLKDVGVGEYIMEIKRDGFLPRWMHVTVVDADVNLGHKEILPGDVDNSRNVTISDRSKTIARLTNTMNSLYAPLFDFDGTGSVLYTLDLEYVNLFTGAVNYTIYVDSYEIYLRTW